jgi:tRNA dimethylallyltransferase
MKSTLKQIAIIGPTASGKSSLAIELAQEYGAAILSLDSLSVYREIDIASAKPTPEERGDIPHYGIDLLDPDEKFDVMKFLELYGEVRGRCEREGRPLIVTGGSSFYLKILMEGISPMPRAGAASVAATAQLMGDLAAAYAKLSEIDPLYAAKISENDRYRIEKALLIFFETSLPPTLYFEKNPPISIVGDELPVFEIEIERAVLRERIALRTEKMFADGLVDEVCELEYRYGRAPNCMKAIGIREVLSYLDGTLGYEETREKIVVNTARLAKRQSTFNRSQFPGRTSAPKERLKESIAPLLDSAR